METKMILLLSLVLTPLLLLWSSWGVLAWLLVLSAVLLLKTRDRPKIAPPSDFHVVVIGAGVSGICVGRKLKSLGIRFTILEKASKLGGTWWENTYPGCACDIPSHLYSYSFFLNPRWSRNYSRQQEILEYLQQAADKFGVSGHIKFSQKVVSNTWDPKRSLWTVRTESGLELLANVIVTGSGALHVPKMPEFPGMEKFEGESFHSAKWVAGYQAEGKRVGVVGTGASAVQAVPALASRDVSSLTVFQRTPCWSPPRMDYKYPEAIKTMFAVLPFTNTLHRWFIFWRNEFRFWVLFVKDGMIAKLLSPLVHRVMRKHVRSVVKDPRTAQQLTPSYDMGCKRITPSDDYLQTFNKANVKLVTETIEEVTSRGIKTVDGTEHELDTILYATGFDLEASLRAFTQTGTGKEDNMQEWKRSPYAYKGITHPNHPNFFILLGPGTGLGHNSIIFMIECQVNYTADAIVKLLQAGAKSMSVRPEILKNYVDFAQQNMKGKVFADNSQVKGWYRNEEGVNWTMWPLDLVSYWWTTFSCDLSEYLINY